MIHTHNKENRTDFVEKKRVSNGVESEHYNRK